MDGLFGSPPFPIVTDLPDTSISSASARLGDAAREEARRRRWARLATGVAVAAAAALAGWWAGSTREPTVLHRPDDAPIVPAAMAASPNADVDGQPPLTDAADAEEMPAIAPEVPAIAEAKPASSATPVAVDPDASSAADREPSRTRRRGNKSRRNRRQDALPANAEPDRPPHDRHEGMLPPSMQ
jgi:hypothetical protein